MRSPAAEVDVAILGGGLAGLSLAIALIARAVTPPRIAILEARDHYIDDRVWCRFDGAPTLFPRADVMRYHRARIALPGRTRTHQLARAYVRVDAGRLYADAAERLTANARCQLVLATPVSAVHSDDDGVTVSSTAGTVRARLVVDTRPSPLAGIDVWQRFTGYRIHVDRPTFDPDEVTLMDFAASDGRGVRFMYLVPFDAHSALVEDTWFTTLDADLPAVRPAVEAYLSTRFGVHRFDVSASERGALPMGQVVRADGGRAPSPRILKLGVAAGDIRAATGYAFDTIQRRALSMADALLAALIDDRAPGPLAPAFGARTRWMDRVFLKAVARDPGAAPAWFAALFERVPIERLTRFLIDGGRAGDALAVMRALPARPFASAAFG